MKAFNVLLLKVMRICPNVCLHRYRQEIPLLRDLSHTVGVVEHYIIKLNFNCLFVIKNDNDIIHCTVNSRSRKTRRCHLTWEAVVRVVHNLYYKHCSYSRFKGDSVLCRNILTTQEKGLRLYKKNCSHGGHSHLLRLNLDKYL